MLGIRLLPAALVLAIVSAPAPASVRELETFDAYVRQAMADWRVPGLAVAVVKDGETVFLDGYGSRNLETGAPVDARTRFAAASTTKAMTAAAIGMLVDEKRVTWDTPVEEVLPEFRLYDPWMSRELTLRDLLTHRAGLGNADFLWYAQDVSTAEVLSRMRFAPPAYSPRSGFIYQNILYGAAGEAIRALSGQSWEEFVRQRIFLPLEMVGSAPTLAWLDGQDNVTGAHHEIEGQIRVIETDPVASIPAAGSAWTSVSDMARWMTFLLAGGVTPDGRRLLSEEVVEELFHPQVLLRRDNFYPTAKLTEPNWLSYGLGWFQHDYRGRKVDFHTGSIDGLVAIVGLIREENLGVCVLANLDHAELRHALMYRVFDSFLGGPQRDWHAELFELYAERREKQLEERKKVEESRVEETSPSLELDGYAGEYSHPLFGSVTVSSADGGLRLRYGQRLVGDLGHWNYDTFRLVWERPWMGKDLVTFLLDEKGRSARLRFSSGIELARVSEE